MAKKPANAMRKNASLVKTYSTGDGSWLDYIESAMKQLGPGKATVYRMDKSGRWTGETGGDAGKLQECIGRVRKHLADGVDSTALFDAMELGSIAQLIQRRGDRDWVLKRLRQGGNQGQSEQSEIRAKRAIELIPVVRKEMPGRCAEAIQQEVGRRVAAKEGIAKGFSASSVRGWIRKFKPSSANA